MRCRACGAINTSDGATVCEACQQPLAPPSIPPMPPVAPRLPPMPPVVPALPASAGWQLPGYYAPAPCLVCGTALAAHYYQCPACRTPRGMTLDPDDSTASTFLPGGATMGSGGAFAQSGFPAADILPAEASGLCWGPLNPLVSPFWCFAHGMTSVGVLLLLCLLLAFALPGVIVVNLIAAPILLAKGREYGWQKRRFTSVAAFRQAQKVWGWWALGLSAGLPVLVYLLMAISANTS